MSDTENEPNTFASLIMGAIILAGCYFGYTTFFPSDRAQVRSCIEGMMEAARGSGMYGEFRSELAVVDDAASVVIEQEERLPLGADVLLTLHYNADGNRGTIVCEG